jgi:hypothetical protein
MNEVTRMSKTLLVEVGKRGTLQLPPEIAAELPEGTKLVVKRGRHGGFTLRPLEERKRPPVNRAEAMTGIRDMVDELHRIADEKGITEQDIQAAVKRIRAQKLSQCSDERKKPAPKWKQAFFIVVGAGFHQLLSAGAVANPAAC